MSKSTFSEVEHIVAVGDLHGNFEGFRKILVKNGIIDKDGHWKAKNTHLVQLGDILGRGGEPGKIFNLLRQLELEALSFNSRVHVLLGNHEAMSMSGLFMYNTIEEFRDLSDQDFFEPLESIGGDAEEEMASLDWRPVADPKLEKRLDMLGCREFRATLSPWGKVGRWLGMHDSAVKINETLFVHGGLNQEYGCQHLDALNDQVRSELGANAPPDANRDIMLKREGPQWNREFTLRPNEVKGRVLSQVLDFHACERMVVGHTPTKCIDPSREGQIVSLYDEKLLCVDTGIGKTYGEHLSALVLEKESISAIYH